MSTKPDQVPEWNSGGANNTEPDAGKKALGWIPGEDNVSGSFLNWLMRLYYTWLRWIDERTTDAAAPRIGLRGIDNVAEDADSNGINTTGIGTGKGLNAIGGETSGEAVRGTGGAPNGPALHGVGTGTGAGVIGESEGGYGVIAQGKAVAPVRASGRVVPQNAAPSSPQEGDYYQNSTDHKFYVYNGTAWIGLSASLAGEVVGSVFLQDFDIDTYAAAKIPLDGTKPQNTEGAAYIELAYTAKKVGNRLRIRCTGLFSHDAAAGATIGLAAFKDATADAIITSGETLPQFYLGLVDVEWEEPVADLLSHTYKFRVGASTNATAVYKNFDGTAGHWYDGSLAGGGAPSGGVVEITEFEV